MMEISFYVLLVLAALVLVLAMWACAQSSTSKWGPDLTLELPAYVLQQAFFPTATKPDAKIKRDETVPSVPSELPCDPLLSNEQPMGVSTPPRRYYQPILMNMSTAVQVLPTRYAPQHKTRPFYTFTTEEPA